MPLYFMHLKGSTEEVLDLEGVEMPVDAIPVIALRQARDCMAGDIKAGRLDLRYRIDVHDEAGEIVHRLPFEDAVLILR